MNIITLATVLIVGNSPSDCGYAVSDYDLQMSYEEGGDTEECYETRVYDSRCVAGMSCGTVLEVEE